MGIRFKGLSSADSVHALQTTCCVDRPLQSVCLSFCPSARVLFLRYTPDDIMSVVLSVFLWICHPNLTAHILPIGSSIHSYMHVCICNYVCNVCLYVYISAFIYACLYTCMHVNIHMYLLMQSMYLCMRGFVDEGGLQQLKE